PSEQNESSYWDPYSLFICHSTNQRRTGGLGQFFQGVDLCPVLFYQFTFLPEVYRIQEGKVLLCRDLDLYFFIFWQRTSVLMELNRNTGFGIQMRNQSSISTMSFGGEDEECVEVYPTWTGPPLSSIGEDCMVSVT